MRSPCRAIILCSSLLIAACGIRPSPRAVKKQPSPTPAAGKAAPPAAYPDPASTPGVAYPDITQANIAQTICSKSWSTKSIRPPSSYTTKLKLQQLNAMGLTGHASDYEEDHFIPLEMGGDPRDPGNLWPEPWNLKVGQDDYGAHTKDFVESFLHDEICFSVPNHPTNSSKKYRAQVSITLARGQAIIANDWYACFQNMQAGQPCQ